jgi:hypothetical protein
LLVKIAEFCGQEFGPLNFFFQDVCQLVKKIGHPWFGDVWLGDGKTKV